MQTMEELGLLTKAQLTGIAQNLDVAVPKKAKHAQLVQLVFDVQQPDGEADKEPKVGDDVNIDDNAPGTDAKRASFSEEDADKMLSDLGTALGGELEPEGADANGVATYSVLDVVGEVIARGTFLELRELAKAKTPDPEADTLGEVDLGEEVAPEPTKVQVATETVNGHNVEVAKALNPLARLGLQHQIVGETIKLSLGSKTITTTLNQPKHVIIRTAEAFCKV